MTPFGYILSVTGDCSQSGVGAISLTPTGGTAPYTIEWVSPSLPPVEITSLTPSIRTNLFSGVYGLRLNDSTLPENQSFYVNIPVSSGVTASILQVNPTSCGNNNGSVTATSSSDFSTTTYNLYDGSNNLVSSYISDTSIQVFDGLSAGTYFIQVIDLGGCTGKSQDFIITDVANVDFGFYIVPNSFCQIINQPLGKIYVTGQTGTPPFTYLWSDSSTGSTLTGLTSGFYTCEVTDANGCKKSKSAYVEDVDPLGFAFFSAVTPTCFASDGSLTINITGGTAPYYYSASTGTVAISYAQSFTLNNIPGGPYGFFITDAGLCSIYEATSISSPQSIGSVTLNTVNSSCSNNNGYIQISLFQGTPPFIYTLIKPDSSTESVTINSSNYSFFGLSAGTYDVFVEDQSSCQFSQTVYILTSNLFEIYTSVTGTTCNQNNGAIQIFKTTGGTEPFNYFLDDVSVAFNTSLTALTLNNISAGSHVVSVVDADGCSQSEIVYVNPSSPLQFSLFTENCVEGNDGSITAFISSGNPPFTFNWSENVAGNPQSINVNGLSAGTYNLTIVDSLGCYFTGTTTISCESISGGYYNFNVGEQDLTGTTQNNFGLLQMLNDGFRDLTDGNPNCIFNSAIFEAIVQIQPDGLTTSSYFYTGKTLTDVPPSNLWSNAITTLLESVPGIDSVTIEPETNELQIQKSPSNPFLDNQIINLDIAIEYDISC